jgi:hypothetical protein
MEVRVTVGTRDAKGARPGLRSSIPQAPSVASKLVPYHYLQLPNDAHRFRKVIILRLASRYL